MFVAQSVLVFLEVLSLEMDEAVLMMVKNKRKGEGVVVAVAAVFVVDFLLHPSHRNLWTKNPHH